MEDDPEREFDDELDDIYAYEKEREVHHPYIQRETELGVIDSGLEYEAKTLVMMPPTIFGIGTGLFNKHSIQIPTFIRGAIDQGHAVMIGGGAGVRDQS